MHGLSPVKGVLFSLFFTCLFASVSLGQDDSERQRAERLLADAEVLFGKNTPEDREKAYPMFVEAAELWEKAGDDERLIATLNKLNDISYFRSDFKQCIFYSSKILPLSQKIGNRNLEGGVLGNLGLYHYLLGDSRVAVKFLERSAEILGEIGERQRQSIALSNVGQVYYDLGEIKAALEVFDRAVQLKRETGDRKGEGIVLNNLGFVSNEGGEKRKALEYYETALEIAIEVEDQRTRGTLLSNIGSVHQDRGDFQKAFEYYIQSLELRREISDVYGQGISMQNIASLYKIIGDQENALNFANQALEIYQKGGFRREEALVLSSIGSIHVLTGDRKKALEFDLKALDIQRTVDNKSGYAFILQNIGKSYLENKEYQTALEYFYQALKTAEESNDVAAAARNLISIARTNEKLGRLEIAEAEFEKAAANFREIQAPFDLADALYFQARFEQGRGRREAAIGKISEAIQIVEELRSTISSQNWQAGFFGEQQKYYELYISLLAAQHKRFPERGYGAMALEASEKARARSLLDSLGESRSDIRGSIPAELIEEESVLRSTINVKDRQRVEALKRGSTARAVELEKELASHIRAYEDVQARVRRISPEYASLNRPEPLDLATIRSEVLDKDTVLLEYFLGEDASFLFFVTHDGLEVIDLPNRKSIETMSRTLIEDLRARTREIAGETPAKRTARLRSADTRTESGLRNLGKLLISPVAGKIRDKRLLIVASGVLQYIPFAALRVSPAAVGRGTMPERRNRPLMSGASGGAPFLIETNEIVHLPSASVLPSLRRARTNETESKNLIAILADPVFGADDPRLAILSRRAAGASEISAAIMRDPRILPPGLRSDLSRLRFSRTEAEAIAELATKEQRFVALDFAANLNEAVGENVRRSRIVHFATHGVVNSQFPVLSSLVFSMVDENGKERDGHLRLHDIYNLRLEAEIVVLSACETALGKEIRGEGIVGLARGFMYAGAPSVVASLWRVEDRATADLMKRFYQRMLNDELSPAAALRQAQISMLKERATAQPFYWAGFTLQGDWK